jgi:hypothetical protein
VASVTISATVIVLILVIRFRRRDRYRSSVQIFRLRLLMSSVPATSKQNILAIAIQTATFCTHCSPIVRRLASVKTSVMFFHAILLLWTRSVCASRPWIVLPVHWEHKCCLVCSHRMVWWAVCFGAYTATRSHLTNLYLVVHKLHLVETSICMRPTQWLLYSCAHQSDYAQVASTVANKIFGAVNRRKRIKQKWEVLILWPKRTGCSWNMGVFSIYETCNFILYCDVASESRIIWRPLLRNDHNKWQRTHKQTLPRELPTQHRPNCWIPTATLYASQRWVEDNENPWIRWSLTSPRSST